MNGGGSSSCAARLHQDILLILIHQVSGLGRYVVMFWVTEE